MEKTFLYHMVPKDMHGSILYPLNYLKNLNPELYSLKAEKYKDREHIMDQFIPTLECKWNDVLHFSAIKPEDFKEALLEAGMVTKEMKFYQIDPNLFDPKNTTVYIDQKKIDGDKMNSKNFVKYNPEKLQEYSNLSQITKDYYKEKFSKGERPLLFVGVPHILFKGSIDISDLPIVTV